MVGPSTCNSADHFALSSLNYSQFSFTSESGAAAPHSKSYRQLDTHETGIGITEGFDRHTHTIHESEI